MIMSKTTMYYLKEILYDDNVFIIYRHKQNVFGVFFEGEINGFYGEHLLKFVYNTKQCRDIIKNYKKYIL